VAGKTIINDMPLRETGRLPAWWRHLLIALAMLVLSSCSAPMLPLGSEAQLATALAPLLAAQLTADEKPDVGDVSVADSAMSIESPSVPETVPTALGGTFETLSPVTLDDAPVGPLVIPPDGVMADHHPECLDGSCANCAGGPVGFAVDPNDPCAARLIGPSDEYLCDGGDFGSPAGVRADWTVEGVEQEDAIAHYDTLDGRVILTPSNRVCIYAPRFAAVRRVTSAVAHERGQFIEVVLEEETPVRADESQPVASSLQRHAVAINLGERPPSIFRNRQQAGGLENLQATMAAYTSLAVYANLEIIRTGQVDNTEKAWLANSIESAVTWTGDQAAQVIVDSRLAVAMESLRQAGVVYQTDGPDSPRLRLVKLASSSHALPGEEVEFTLRYDNVGDQLIGNVTIVDNLTTRLQYIPESAQSSVDANFITAPNTGGSTILRWEIHDPVEPGEGGVLRFRTRVR
jgi:uncharacterized repeat protein (TIGR01451 family)